MSNQFFYIQLKFTRKLGSPITQPEEAVVAVPKGLVQRRQAKLGNEHLQEVIAIDLARGAAIATFPNVAGRSLGLYDEHPPIWYQERPEVMNERPCDHEENGIQAWRIVQEPVDKVVESTPLLA